MELIIVVTIFATASAFSLPLRIDHQFRGQGDPLGVFDSRFNDGEMLKDLGYVAQAGRYAETTVPFDTLEGGPFYPNGSPGRAWMDSYAMALKKEMATMKAAGLTVLNHIDFVVLPHAVAQKYGSRICVPPKTSPPCSFQFNKDLVHIVRTMFAEMFSMFPDLDGIIIRTGEHYTQDLPFHFASRPHLAQDGPNPIQWLRDNVAAGMNKTVIWRTWSVHPVLDGKEYLNVSSGVTPHQNFYFSAKVQGWDYWRWTNFNPILGIGHHQQVVEVSCQRSYEGKGAFPSYIGRGTIEGFPEQSVNTNYTKGVRGLRDVIGPQSTVTGLWTWSRGDGNWGPYTKAGELWQTLNCAVVVAFAQAPHRSEADIFLSEASSLFALSAADALKLHSIALLAEEATLKGRYCAAYDSVNVPKRSPSNTWMRDYALSDSLAPTMAWLAARNRTAAARAEKAEVAVSWGWGKG